MPAAAEDEDGYRLSEVPGSTERKTRCKKEMAGSWLGKLIRRFSDCVRREYLGECIRNYRPDQMFLVTESDRSRDRNDR